MSERGLRSRTRCAASAIDRRQSHAPSMQSRVSNLLAIGLMSLLGLGMLTWYYANAMTRQSRARQSAQALSTNRAQGEMPSAQPGPDRSAGAPARSAATGSGAACRRRSPARRFRCDLRFLCEPAPAIGVSGAPQPKTAEQLALERQLSGAVYSTQGSIADRGGRGRPRRRRLPTGAARARRFGGIAAARRQRRGARASAADAAPVAAQGRISSIARWKRPSIRRCRA